jgi:[methyl-Co(III) methanol-specific corrinoid protein]:coenzyme M methyltransferase
MGKYQRGNKPAFLMSPFLPLTCIKERGLQFNNILRDSQSMIETAMMSFDFGFESTMLPFDMNVEAEILGAGVRYHEGFEGHPVYPTITDRPVATADDIEMPEDLAEKGRLPVILKTIRSIQDLAQDHGSVGVIIPGPIYIGRPGHGDVVGNFWTLS